MFEHEYPYTNYHDLNLDWVIEQIKKFEQRVNTLEEGILEKANAYVDEQLQLAIETLQSDYVAFINEVNAKIANLDSSYDSFVKDVSDRIVLINSRIDKMQDTVDSVLMQANAYTQQAIANNNEYIIEQTTKALGGVKVLNYFTGMRVSIQEMFDYLAQFHLTNAITFAQMATREKTYNEFNTMNMSYTDLALDGGGLFV